PRARRRGTPPARPAQTQTGGATAGAGGGTRGRPPADTLNLSQAIVTKNSVTGGNGTSTGVGGNGAGIWSAGHVNALNSQITLNTTSVGDGQGGKGGGIYESGGTVALNNTLVGNNSAAIAGGGLYVLGGSGTISNTTRVNSNTASHHGGGIYYNGAGALSLSNSEVRLNVAGSFGTPFGLGGGIYARFSGVSLTNSRVSGNTSFGSGG